MEESKIQSFWQEHPCGDFLVGGLDKAFKGDCEQFFVEYDRYRYTHEGHILTALDQFDWKGKKVLEIGLGQGADSAQLIKRGAQWSGLDLTQAAVDRVRLRAEVEGLAIDDVKVGSALDNPYPDASFDIVFSHGVLHHIPEIGRAQAEIARVLKPGGKLIIMMYARYSLNYQVSIRIVRRVILALAVLLGLPLPERHELHRENAKKVGLWNYLKLDNFIHRSTDGAGNPYSKVYSLADVEKDFPEFKVVRSFKHWMHAPPLPTAKLPGGSLFGWHLWVELEKR